MQLTGLVLTFFLALGARALPVETTDLASFNETLIESRDPKHHHHHHGKYHHKDNFLIHVHNKCPFSKEVALYSVTSKFKMVQRSRRASIPPGGKHTIHAPFKAIGMRLSGHAELGLDGQWQPSALLEFGYATYAGQEGTAYDLSVMAGSDPDIGIGVYPHNPSCPSKTCFPWDCPPDQGWTNPDQVNLGSPADTVCYHKTNFKFVYCP